MEYSFIEGELQMKDIENIQELIATGNCNFSLKELKELYSRVNTRQETVVAQIKGIKHIYHRNKGTDKLSLDKDLLKYDKTICSIINHRYYPLDLCNLTFYDENTNRYGNGIIIPRLNKFVMINDMDLINRPVNNSFYTIGINEQNEACGSLVDKVGNIYRMYGYENSEDKFKIQTISKLNYKRFLMCDYFGYLISYDDRPVFAMIDNAPNMIFERDMLLNLCQSVEIDQLDFSQSREYMENFDNDFMNGSSYVKKLK